MMHSSSSSSPPLPPITRTTISSSSNNNNSPASAGRIIINFDDDHDHDDDLQHYYSNSSKMHPSPLSLSSSSSSRYVGQVVCEAEQPQAQRRGGGGGGCRRNLGTSSAISHHHHHRDGSSTKTRTMMVLFCTLAMFNVLLIFYMARLQYYNENASSISDNIRDSKVSFMRKTHKTNATTNTTTTRLEWRQPKALLPILFFDDDHHHHHPSSSSSSPTPRLYAFIIRDALRLTPVQPPPGFHVFDYTNVHAGNIAESVKASSSDYELFVDGFRQDVAPCVEYNTYCYNLKVLQSLAVALRLNPPSVLPFSSNNNNDKATATITEEEESYFFYMESDHELCTTLGDLTELAVTQGRYFIGTSIGASGWIMSRAFVVDLMDAIEQAVQDYRQRKMRTTILGPDVIAAGMLQAKEAWSVTRQYLTSHTLNLAMEQSPNAKPLTLRQDAQGNFGKHLPRCGEPHRDVWPKQEEKKRCTTYTTATTNSTFIARVDKYGWDYFDFQQCPDATIYPCQASDDSLVWVRNHRAYRRFP